MGISTPLPAFPAGRLRGVSMEREFVYIDRRSINSLSEEIVANSPLGESILVQAIHFEHQARDFYARSAEKVKASQAVKKFAQLSKEEARHAKLLAGRLKKLYNKEMAAGSAVPPKQAKLKAAETAVRAEADMLEIVSVGILLENGSIKNYEELLETATEKEDIKLLGDLLNLEIGHKKILQREYDRITRAGSMLNTGYSADNVGTHGT
jgi:rubrerythrin